MVQLVEGGPIRFNLELPTTLTWTPRLWSADGAG